MERLGTVTLSRLRPGVVKPGYAQVSITAGIVHFGAGISALGDRDGGSQPAGHCPVSCSTLSTTNDLRLFRCCVDHSLYRSGRALTAIIRTYNFFNCKSNKGVYVMTNKENWSI